MSYVLLTIYNFVKHLGPLSYVELTYIVRVARIMTRPMRTTFEARGKAVCASVKVQGKARA